MPTTTAPTTPNVIRCDLHPDTGRSPLAFVRGERGAIPDDLQPRTEVYRVPAALWPIVAGPATADDVAELERWMQTVNPHVVN